MTKTKRNRLRQLARENKDTFWVFCHLKDPKINNQALTTLKEYCKNQLEKLIVNSEKFKEEINLFIRALCAVNNKIREKIHA